MPDDFITNLEHLGEIEVRRKLAAGEFGSTGNRYQMVVDWLKNQSEARAGKAMCEQIDLARAAVDSARDAARESRTANTNARIAIAIAVVTIIVSVIALLK